MKLLVADLSLLSLEEPEVSLGQMSRGSSGLAASELSPCEIVIYVYDETL